MKKRSESNSELPRNVGLPREKFVEGLEAYVCVEI